MPERIAPILLGTRVAFADRWQGRVSGVEVDEDWNVFNVVVTSGFWVAGRSVRLPFTAATEWSEEAVQIGVNSFKAFAREVPPVAAPSRPLDAKTPTSHPGARFAGLIVRRGDRRAAEVILARGVRALYRTPVADISFSGKTMAIGHPPEQLVRFHPDKVISAEIHERMTEDAAIPTDDKRFLHVDVEEGVVTLSGNVRVAQTRDYAERLAQRIDGAVTVRNQILDDFAIEAAIGQALNASGVQHTGRVYVRSNLGEVLVDGAVPTQRAAEDVVRTVARVPGVRAVVNRLRVPSLAAAQS